MKTNYHTHTTFCDGKATIEQMVLAAIDKKFDILGFSSHAIYPYKTSWHIQPNEYQNYSNTIIQLKEKYQNQIEIYKGFEVDYLPLISSPQKNIYEQFNSDYIIGSVHYVINPDNPSLPGFPQDCGDFPLNVFSIDGSLEEVQHGLKVMFNNDYKKVVQTYFSLVRDMISNCDFDIIGHLDILRKRNGILHFFDENDDWYKREQLETVKTISRTNKIVEINCGGIPRGTLNDTYPSVPFLEKLFQSNIPVMINSDAHNIQHLDGGFDVAFKNAKTAGYTEIQFYSNGKWHSQKIN